MTVELAEAEWFVQTKGKVVALRATAAKKILDVESKLNKGELLEAGAVTWQDLVR